MSSLKIDERKLTQLDFDRLSRLDAATAPSQFGAMLGEADVVPSRAIAPDVVTMYAKFTVRDVRQRRLQAFVLCYPPDAEPAAGFISVLSPAGLALLGLPVGALAAWPVPGGGQTTVQIEEILFQPEATGDYVT